MKDSLTTLWGAFGRYRWHVIALVVFGFLSALLEGIGINAAIPLMSFFMGGGGEATDFVTKTIQSFFAFLHIPFSFRSLLIHCARSLYCGVRLHPRMDKRRLPW